MRQAMFDGVPQLRVGRDLADFAAAKRRLIGKETVGIVDGLPRCHHVTVRSPTVMRHGSVSQLARETTVSVGEESLMEYE